VGTTKSSFLSPAACSLIWGSRSTRPEWSVWVRSGVVMAVSPPAGGGDGVSASRTYSPISRPALGLSKGRSPGQFHWTRLVRLKLVDRRGGGRHAVTAGPGAGDIRVRGPPGRVQARAATRPGDVGCSTSSWSTFVSVLAGRAAGRRPGGRSPEGQAGRRQRRGRRRAKRALEDVKNILTGGLANYWRRVR
jgi:hypothetical protein